MDDASQTGQNGRPEPPRPRKEDGPPSPQGGSYSLPEVLRLLHDPKADPRTLNALAEDRRWLAIDAVRASLVLRNVTPLHTALRLTATLRWRDLARVSEDVRVYPAVRARAEQMLLARVVEMALGEKIAFARVATRPLIKRLKQSRDPEVLRALLVNPRLTETEVTAIAGDPGVPPAILSVIARSDRWNGSAAVKLALARNAVCPAVDSLRSLRNLESSELRRIADDPSIPQLVRIGAARRLERA